VRAVFEDAEEPRAALTAKTCAEVLRVELTGTGILVLGPAPAPIAMLRGRHRQHVLIKAPLASPHFARLLASLRRQASELSRSRMSIDVDPAAML
jgi:primosomal protein N' (replication factor Y)